MSYHSEEYKAGYSMGRIHGLLMGIVGTGLVCIAILLVLTQ